MREEFEKNRRELLEIEALSCGSSPVHRLHPGAKVLSAVVYLICLMSVERHDLSKLTAFLFCPVLTLAAADIPVRSVLRRAAAALPFALMAGISSLFMERGLAGELSGIRITWGVLAFLVLLFRTLLCVSIVLILAATTPLTDLLEELENHGAPRIMTRLISLLYRYLSVLAAEAETMLTAFRLRSGGRQWPEVGEFAAFLSQLFFRSVDRAERIYEAMLCRGEGARQAENAGAKQAGNAGVSGVPAGVRRGVLPPRRRWSSADWLYFLSVTVSSAVFLRTDVSGFLLRLFRI